MLQCSIPVFAGLLPDPHNAQVLRLLFVLCHWHGLAKLRLHTDETLEIFERVTKDLCNRIRSFALDTCPCFATKELPREAQSRRRRQAQQNPGRSGRSHDLASHAGHGQRLKTLNLQTYKLHALADYPSQIRMYGTTDSYSTQAVRTAFSFTRVYNSHSLLPRENLSTVQVKADSPELVTRHTYRSWPP